MKESVRIVVDERERPSGIPDELARLHAVVDYAQLDVGDYIVATDSAVERKSVKDLVLSIYDGRLFTQCAELARHFARPILIVEGSTETFEEIVDNPMVVYGALASVALDFRMAMIHTPSASHTARALVAMASRAVKGKQGPLLRKVKKGNAIKQQQLSILASLPGVGDKLAARMLEKFKTPMKALNASTAELARIEGMGHIRAVKLRKVLDQVQVDNDVEQTALDGYDDNRI
jgi:DNA excision repair protein ERCC-4